MLTGNKLRDKVYIKHTGYPGGIRTKTAAESLARDPTSLLRAAVLRMLPRNQLRHARARKLRLFPGDQHPGFDGSLLLPLAPPARSPRLKSPLPLDFVLPEGLVPMNEEVFAAMEERRRALLATSLARRARLDQARLALQQQEEQAQ